MPGSKTAKPDFPLALAMYIATSALRTISAASPPASRALAMPMLALTVMVWSPMTYGTRRSRTSRSAIDRDRLRSCSSSVRMANSSPPSRATRSPWRTRPLMRSVTAMRSESPAAWPSVSLITLKSSRSMNRTAVILCSAATASCVPRVRSSVSWNMRRLAAPVSESRSARSCTLRRRTAFRRFSAATAENWPSTDAMRRSIPNTVRDRCSTTIAPTGRPSANIGDTSRFRASGSVVLSSGLPSGLIFRTGSSSRRSHALRMMASAWTVPDHSAAPRDARTIRLPSAAPITSPRSKPNRAARPSSTTRAWSTGSATSSRRAPTSTSASRSVRRWRSSRSFMAEKIDVARAKSQNDVTLRTGIRSKSMPRPGMTSTGGRSDAACA